MSRIRTFQPQKNTKFTYSPIKDASIHVTNSDNDPYIIRALIVYEKHYGTKYNITIIREIIYRLHIKDKLKKLKQNKKVPQSRNDVKNALLSFNFHINYINVAFRMYEVMLEMFETKKGDEDVYDLEFITEIIMRLRAKYRNCGK
eukprot:377720_1